MDIDLIFPAINGLLHPQNSCVNPAKDMAVALQIHCHCICVSCPPRCFSSENHPIDKINSNPHLVIEPRISKPAGVICQARFEPRKPNSPPLTRALRAFADSGLMENALQLFDETNQADPFVWNVMISGFVNCGLYQEAVEFYRRMVSAGIKADTFTYPFVMKAFAGILTLEEGEKVHSKLIKVGFDSNVYICNSLISFYMKLGCFWAAEKLFDEMPERDSVSWNSLISGYLALGDGLRSLTLFRVLLGFGIIPDRFSIISALGACSLVYCPKIGKEIHCRAIRSGLAMVDFMVRTSILDMYSKCGVVGYAERIFNGTNPGNNIDWNIMIGCYARNGQLADAFLYLRKMSEDNGLQPDTVTLINVLPACKLLEIKSVHGYAIRRGYTPHTVLETALIDMYGECGKLKSAEAIFYQMTEKNLVSWNSIIAAYVQNNKNNSALELFQDLWKSPLGLDSTTIANLLPAYAESALLSEGAQLHAYIIKSELGSNTIILNSLIHMYAMCGDIEAARKCFDCIMFKDVVSWNSIIMGYAVHGFGRVSIQLFSEMIRYGVKPSKSTFASVLSACSVAGMIDEGWEYFSLMKREYGIDPGIEHYGCMIDLLGRSGNLSLTKSFINEMPFVPTARIWGSLLNASRNHNDIALAEFAAEQIFCLEHDNTGCYVLLSNMYAEAGRWEDVQRINLLMEKKGLSRTTSCSVVETKCRSHMFTNGDKSHIETSTIYDVLDIILGKINKEAYVHGNVKFRPEIMMKKKANSPANHSVRLATCYSLISTAVGNPVIVKNNTRICRNCHEFMKNTSRITRREIIVGDSKIFHHFCNGGCSCGDYW